MAIVAAAACLAAALISPSFAGAADPAPVAEVTPAANATAPGTAIPTAPFEIATVALARAGTGNIPEPFAGVSTNGTGDVAYVFAAESGDVLFLRDALGLNHHIIAVGEPLAGSTVARLVAMPNSLDSYRQVTFYAQLADRTTGLFRASLVPGPFLISPAWGYRDRPITFHLTGNGFAPGVEVRVGSTKAAGITVLSPTELTGFIPAGAQAGIVDVATSRGGGAERILRRAFEFRDPPIAGCNGFWPDHRPPDLTTSSFASGWIFPWGVIALYTFARRRWARRHRRHV